MARSRSLLPPPAQACVVALPFLLAALLPLLYSVVRDAPESYGCWERPAATQAADVAAYAAGADLTHAGVIACALGAIVLLSVQRIGGGPFGVGWPTFAGGVAIAVMALLAAGSPGGSRTLALLPFALVALLLSEVAAPLGAEATGVIAALLLVTIAAVAGASAVAGRSRGPQAALWALVVLTGAHLIVVDLAGHGPYFC